MTNDRVYNQFRELSWKRKLTTSEEAKLREWLAANPAQQADWEAEVGLTEALGQMPNAPVATNFTAQVLQTVEQEALMDMREQEVGELVWRKRWRWLPKMAFAALVLCAGLFSYHQVQAARRTALAESVAVVSEVSSLPSPEVLQDFDAIYALNQTPPADEDLLNLLK